MLAIIKNIKSRKRERIKEKIIALNTYLDSQVTLWTELFHNGDSHSAVISNNMVETEKEIMKLERQLY